MHCCTRKIRLFFHARLSHTHCQCLSPLFNLIHPQPRSHKHALSRTKPFCLPLAFFPPSSIITSSFTVPTTSKRIFKALFIDPITTSSPLDRFHRLSTAFLARSSHHHVDLRASFGHQHPSCLFQLIIPSHCHARSSSPQPASLCLCCSSPTRGHRKCHRWNHRRRGLR